MICNSCFEFPCAADFISRSQRKFRCRWLQCRTSHLCPTRCGHDVYICTSAHKPILHDTNAINIVTFNIITAQSVKFDLIKVTCVDVSLP